MDTYINQTPKDTEKGDLDKKVVLRALETLEQGQNINEDRRPTLELIQESYENAFMVDETDPVVFSRSKLLSNVVKKVYERLDFLKYDIKFFGLKSENEFLLKAVTKKAIETVMRKGGFAAVFKEAKDSVLFRISLLGDAFVAITKQDGDFPIKYEVISQENFNVPYIALQMRNSASGRDVRRACIVFDYDYDTYVEKLVKSLPKKLQSKAKKIQWGDLPNSQNQYREKFNDDDNFESEDLARLGQVCLYIDIDMKEVAMIAGSKATIIQRLNGEDFPYMKDGKPYIPIAHFMGLQSTKGFHNYGIGHYMHQDNLVDELLKNKTIAGILQEINPIQYMKVQPGKRAEIQGLIYQAEQQIAEGHHGIVIDEIDESGQGNFGQVEVLSGKNANNIQQIAAEILKKDIVDLGVPLQEVDTAASKTATAILSEQEQANTLVREISKRNAPEYRFLIETTIEMMKKWIPRTSKVKIDTSDIEVESEADKAFLNNINLGMVVDFLKKVSYEITMDETSGVSPLSVVELAKLREAYQLSAGRPVSGKILQRLLALRGITSTMDEVQPQPEQAQPETQIPKETQLPPEAML